MTIDFPPALGRYWSAVLLAIAAIVFLLVGAPTKDAVAGAGFAFFGAAATRMIDLARERREETAEEDARRSGRGRCERGGRHPREGQR